MMTRWLSRYHPRYPRSLVYMLQATEYHLGHYVAWLRRVQDFRHVERRGRLKPTLKVKFLFWTAWTTLAVVFGLSVVIALRGSIEALVFALIILLAGPVLLPYFLTLPLLASQIFVQLPLERRAIHRTTEALRYHPAIKIAIAGSFGKTSLRDILQTVLGEGKRVAAPPDSHNTPLGISQFVATLTGKEEIVIFELGEYYPGDVRKLCDMIQPDIGIITGVNEAHLEKFRTLNTTTRTIFELADYLSDRPVYVNRESESAAKRAAAHHLLYSREGVGSWKVIQPQTDLSGTRFTLSHDRDRMKVTSQLLGLHQIGALVVAADIGARLGFTLPQIQRGIGNTRPFPQRLQPIIDAAGVTLLDDSYNGNPDGVRAVIDFLAGLTDHRRWYVTPGLVEMGTRAEEVHRTIGQQLAEASIENVALIRTPVSPHIAHGLAEARFRGQLRRFDDMPSCLKTLPHMTKPGDVVLIQNDWPDQYL